MEVPSPNLSPTRVSRRDLISNHKVAQRLTNPSSDPKQGLLPKKLLNKIFPNMPTNSKGQSFSSLVYSNFQDTSSEDQSQEQLLSVSLLENASSISNYLSPSPRKKKRREDTEKNFIKKILNYDPSPGPDPITKTTIADADRIDPLGYLCKDDGFDLDTLKSCDSHNIDSQRSIEYCHVPEPIATRGVRKRKFNPELAKSDTTDKILRQLGTKVRNPTRNPFVADKLKPMNLSLVEDLAFPITEESETSLQNSPHETNHTKEIICMFSSPLP